MKRDLTVTFFSNFLLHHQTPFCEAMVKRLGDGFRFVATQPVPQERLAMGYRNYEDVPYALNAYQNDAAYQRAMQLGYDSDVVIMGSASNIFAEKRLKENKLTFRYYERLFKEGKWRLLDPRVIRDRFLTDTRYRNKEAYMLCASAYTARDCKLIFAYPHKMYKWGYFPEVKLYDDIDRVIANKEKHSFLWAGRLIDWKHPEKAVLLAEQLYRNGTDFHMQIIGIGEMEQQLRQMISAKGLQNQVRMTGAMSPDEVRACMEKADIFLFTSDRNEGWGAVLNEALNSACAVVACREIGSVPYLIEDGINGMIFDNRGTNTLYSCVERLLRDKERKTTMQNNAYETMKNVWNADAATDRLLRLIDCIQKGGDPGYASGPCSREE